MAKFMWKVFKRSCTLNFVEKDGCLCIIYMFWEAGPYCGRDMGVITENLGISV